MNGSRLTGLESPQLMFQVATEKNREAELSSVSRVEGLNLARALPAGMQFYLNTHPSELGWPGLAGSLRALRGQHPGLPIVLFGHSLGSAVAVELAGRVPVAALILDGALSSVVERAQELFPYAPVRWIARSRYPSIDRIGRLRNCVAYGPGILDLAHQPDEYVGIEDMLDAATVMCLALADLLGVADSGG